MHGPPGLGKTTLSNIIAHELEVGIKLTSGPVLEKPADLAAYRSIFAKYDLPKENLYCGGLVESTYNEAQTLQWKLAEIKRPVKKIVLVSDRYHLRRGIWIFQQVFGKNLEISAYSTPSSHEIADPQWWKHQAARKQVFGETTKPY